MTHRGLPPVKDSLLAGPIRLATEFVLRRARGVVAIAVVLAVVAGLLTLDGLRFRTSRLDLLNPHSGYNQRWLAYLEEFGEEDDVVVVVEGERAGRVAEVMDRLARRLASEGEHFHSISHRHDLSGLRGKALHFVPLEQLEQLDRWLAGLVPAVKGRWSGLSALERLRAANGQLEVANQSARDLPPEARRQAVGQVRRLLEPLADERPGAAALSAWPELEAVSAVAAPFQAHRLTADAGRIGMILLRFREDASGFSRGSPALERLRGIVDETQRREADVRLGVTGLPVLESDEMQASQSDMLRASLISLVGVAGLFVAGFGVIRHPLMTVLTLILAMAWSFGYVTLAIGHLNILSVSFGVILIGLGIDFGIHYVARYQQLRADVGDSAAALRETAASVGPGIVTGGVTTALAFFTASLTDFTGVAELGRIAGGGILFCVAAALLVLPALIYLADRRRPAAHHPDALPVGQMCWPLSRRPRLILGLTLLATAGCAVGLASLRFDHNLLNLQPRKLESVQWERRLLQRTDRSVWYALSMADSREELLRRRAAFERLPSVQRTEEIASLLPRSDARRRSCIERIAARLRSLPSDVPLLPVPAVAELRQELSRTRRLLRDAGVAESPALEQAARARPEALLARVSRFQQRSAAELVQRLRGLATMADPDPPAESDLPAPLVARFLGKSDRHLLKVYARGDIWDMDALERFVAQVESVDPLCTGHPVQTYYASRQMQRSYIHAAIYSLLAVAIVLMLDFGSIRCTLLALVPLGVGTIQLFGVLGLLGIPLNPANLIVLPLILGIGIDDGVHVVHDFRRQAGRYRLSDSTAMAVLLTSATTMVGFGSMMFARHQGLQSLGQVLTIGVFCCLVTSLVVLPTLLSWLTRHRGECEVQSGGGPEAGGEFAKAVPPVAVDHSPSEPVQPAPPEEEASPHSGTGPLDRAA